MCVILYTAKLTLFCSEAIFSQISAVLSVKASKCVSVNKMTNMSYDMFYLAFENSICTDYVTEKFYGTLEMDIVPIVRGGANYSDIAPAGSYIDANDYSSAQELAEELKRLSNAREEYLNFFTWKATTKVLDGYSEMGCNLCKALHESRPVKTHRDLGAWWKGGGNCR